MNEEEKDLKNIFSRFKKRDFAGTEGQAIKNSSYYLTTTLITKIGSLLFTIIVARLLMPELFGLYSLALATIVLFSAFSDLGIGPAFTAYASESLGLKNPKKAKAYFTFLKKYKIYLLLLVSAILILSSYFVANVYYGKPIFFALLVGGIYIPIVGFTSFLTSAFQANNNFKYPMIKEIIYQILRLALVPVGILFLLKTSIEISILLASIILILTFCYFIALIFMKISLKSQVPFIKSPGEKLLDKDKINLRKFILPLTLTALSGVFFGYIDTIMIGHFVLGEFIGYYSAAFGLISSVAVIVGFAAGGLFPIFSRMQGKSLDKIFKKTKNITLPIAILAAVVSFALSKFIIVLIYGPAYEPATLLFKLFSLIIIITPLTMIYDTYFISRKRTAIIAKLLIATTVINIILNYVLITAGLKFGMLEAVMGACIATIISRFLYMGGLMIFRKNGKKK